MTNLKKGIIIHLCIGAAIVIGVIVLNWQYEYLWSHLLCDGFFVAAVVLLGFGGLKFTRNQGMFDMLMYSVSSTFQIHYPFAKMDSPLQERQETFLDYKERKRAKRKSAAELLWAGLVYLVLALIFLVVDLLLSGL